MFFFKMVVLALNFAFWTNISDKKKIFGQFSAGKNSGWASVPCCPCQDAVGRESWPRANIHFHIFVICQLWRF